MNLSHPLKSGAYCLVMLLLGCAATPSSTPPPTAQKSPVPLATPAPSAPAKPETVKVFENRLQTELTKQSGIKIQQVNCPAQIATGTEKTFNCQAIAEGKSFTVSISPEKNNQELQWSTQGLLVLPKLEETIQQGIQEQFRLDVQANCGGKVRIAKPGDAFQCQITDNRGQTRPVVVQVDDDKGNVTWKL